MSSSNPIGSTAMSDLFFNAGNLDKAMNSAQDKWSDRFGVERITYSFMEKQITGLAGASGSSKVGYQPPGAVPAKTVEAELRQRLYSNNLGLVGDGIVDDTIALQAAFDLSYTLNKPLELEGGTYLISADVFSRREIIPRGFVKFISKRTADVKSVVNLYIERNYILDGIDFEYVNVIFAPRTPDTFILGRGGIENSVLVNSYVIFGQDRVITKGYVCNRNSFVWRLSRAASAIKLLNASNVEISMNTFMEHRAIVEITPTMSYGSDNIVIKNNRSVAGINGILGYGTSMNRITNLQISDNVLTGTLRDAPTAARGMVLLTFCINTKITHNALVAGCDGINLYSCLDTTISDDNKLISTSNFPNIRAMGCPGLKIHDNYFEINSSQAYNLLILDNTKNAANTTGNYKSDKVIVTRNKFKSQNRSVKVETSSNVKLFRNEFIADDISPFGLIWFTDSTNCYEYNNSFTAVSGTPIKNDIAAELKSSEPNGILVPIVKPVPVVAVPVITAIDPSLSNAKSYLITVTNTDYRSIKSACSNTKKTLSNWMVDFTATVAINGSAWNGTSGNLPDLVSNGGLFDSYDSEDFWWARSALIIDRENILSCRDFASPSVSVNYPLDIGAKQIAENTWQSAFFRSPLLVDGVVYDPTITGLLTKNGWDLDLSGRTCLGQKKDGTYIILVVDGKSGESGTTMLKCAQKLLSLGCINAFNLDGGGSTTLWYQGSVINTPSDSGGERSIPHVFYI